MDEVQLKREVGPADMANADLLRHAYVQEFINRVVQAYGYLRATYQFEQGWLHAPSGARTSMTLHPSVIYDHAQRFGRGTVLDDGSVVSGRTGDVVAFALDGVVVDPRATRSRPWSSLPVGAALTSSLRCPRSMTFLRQSMLHLKRLQTTGIHLCRNGSPIALRSGHRAGRIAPVRGSAAGEPDSRPIKKQAGRLPAK